VRVAGIDIGSRTVKLVLLEDGAPALVRVEYNSHDPIEVCRRILTGVSPDAFVATGYGRHLFERYWNCRTITEIRAVALGARRLLPTARSVLDIGGQDTKAVALSGDGCVGKFEMNEKCAAGTGRFLEVMAGALSFSMEDFVRSAESAATSRRVNSLCTVFAESEVVSLVARGAPRDELARGIVESVAARAISMLRRVGAEDDLLFCGGVAWNSCLRGLVEVGTGRKVHVPEDPRTVAALGCAIDGMERSTW